MHGASSAHRPLLDLEAAPVLIIGVTGHRDLRAEDIENLSACIRAKLKILRAQFPGARLLLMSALAEGADQLVAKVAVDELNFELLVPLPLPAPIYRARMQNKTDQSEFDRLLAKATAHFVISTADLPVADSEEPSDLAYAELGRVIASSCAILIALWDGVASEKIGGTAHVVRYVRTGHGLPEPLTRHGSRIDSPEHAIIYHLTTQRRDGPKIPNPCVWQPPILVGASRSEEEAFEHIRDLLAKMDRRGDVPWLRSKG